MKPAPTPKTDKRPIPHAAHPGASIPKKMPMLAEIPILLVDVSLMTFTLYITRLINIPNKMLIMIKLINE